ncbi:3'-5' exonuclease [Spirosoma sordidisoli]|uniref:3'-5' exonuclease n=1 Tax=Spirosoma sordidisoli TaxID=2502893 RepID=A0A4Q2UG13_9BACT|nr:3'-5' exonuclease [Spirosoma sordidisoli]RYC66311.1 3'-5' exonuclease [Spirosoma sordidisoli]
MLFLDVETTGVKPGVDEVLSLAIVDEQGGTLINQFFRPVLVRSWPRAQEQHGISPDFIFSQPLPSLFDLKPTLSALFFREKIVAYNADFDSGFLLPLFRHGPNWSAFDCCMSRYARHVGQPATKPYHRTGFRPWKLSEAVEQTGGNWADFGPPHTALADSRACRHVWQWLDNQTTK